MPKTGPVECEWESVGNVKVASFILRANVILPERLLLYLDRRGARFEAGKVVFILGPVPMKAAKQDHYGQDKSNIQLIDIGRFSTYVK